jgi:DNA-binding XRE family transcriptional regulator
MRPTRAASLRKELRLTQLEAARLLNVSKNTWIRWEKKQCKPDDLALDLLPFRAKSRSSPLPSPPEPCKDMLYDPFDPGVIAYHIKRCKACRLAVKWIIVESKL